MDREVRRSKDCKLGDAKARSLAGVLQASPSFEQRFPPGVPSSIEDLSEGGPAAGRLHSRNARPGRGHGMSLPGKVQCIEDPISLNQTDADFEAALRTSIMSSYDLSIYIKLSWVCMWAANDLDRMHESPQKLGGSLPILSLDVKSMLGHCVTFVLMDKNQGAVHLADRARLEVSFFHMDPVPVKATSV